MHESSLLLPFLCQRRSSIKGPGYSRTILVVHFQTCTRPSISELGRKSQVSPLCSVVSRRGKSLPNVQSRLSANMNSVLRRSVFHVHSPHPHLSNSILFVRHNLRGRAKST